MPSFSVTCHARTVSIEAPTIIDAVTAALPWLGLGDRPDFILANVFEDGSRGYWVGPPHLCLDYYVVAKAGV
jgi:hypothetical protein